MKNKLSMVVVTGVLFLSGCATHTTLPYEASTANVISIQQLLKAQGKSVTIGDVSAVDGVGSNLMCRLAGPVIVQPGKTLVQYIKDAFQKELFMAGVYSTRSSTIIQMKIKEISFSSVSPAYWNISMHISSNHSLGYTVSIKYGFASDLMAINACKNVANAFSPAVQELLKQVVDNPSFSSLAK